MSTVSKLKEARALIERGWCQGVLGRMVDGHAQWCLTGALCEATRIEYGDDAWAAIAKECPEPVFSMWNDAPGRTQAEVLNLFDRAIAAEEAKEKA